MPAKVATTDFGFSRSAATTTGGRFTLRLLFWVRLIRPGDDDVCACVLCLCDDDNTTNTTDDDAPPRNTNRTHTLDDDDDNAKTAHIHDKCACTTNAKKTNTQKNDSLRSKVLRGGHHHSR